MWQALHILKKDTRYLVKEICLLMALMAIFTWAETHIPDSVVPEMLLFIGASFLIARAVHTEAIPGQNQFWLTRPYQWQSLLGAKLSFLVLFISLPLLFAQTCIALLAGFSLKSILPGLFFSQGLIFFVVILPMAALAASTASLVPYLFSFLLLMVAEFLLVENILLFAPRFVTQNHSPALWPAEVEWFRNLIIGILLSSAATVILYLQYRSRRTRISHILGGSLVLIAGLLYYHLPPSLGYKFQTFFSKQRSQSDSLHITFNPTRKKQFPPHDRFLPFKEVEVIVPLELTNIPTGEQVHVDALYVMLEDSHGQTWNAGSTTFNQSNYSSGLTILFDLLKIDPVFAQKAKEQPLTLHGSLYFTYLGDATSATIPIQNNPVSAADRLQCQIEIFNQFYCKSAFRWPEALVQGQFEQGQKEDFIPTVPYSPLPATLQFNPVESHWISAPPEAKQATITFKKPVVHLHKNFEVKRLELPVILNPS